MRANPPLFRKTSLGYLSARCLCPCRTARPREPAAAPPRAPTEATSSDTRAEQTALVLSASLTPGQEEALSPEAELVPAYPPNSERHNSREQGEKPPCRAAPVPGPPRTARLRHCAPSKTRRAYEKQQPRKPKNRQKPHAASSSRGTTLEEPQHEQGQGETVT